MQRFLKELLSLDNDQSTLERTTCLVNSLGQDLIYAVSKKKTPKHILLPYTIKSLTGNVELIQILNRLGHCISYTLYDEIDAAFCMKKLAVTEEGNVPLPESLLPNVNTMLAFDNIDRLEETLSGKGTSHRVNGIAVQPPIHGPHLEMPKPPPIVKSKKRSLEIQPEALPIYAKQHGNPQRRMTHYVEFKEESLASRKKNLIWLLSRYHGAQMENQVISAWTGFNIKVTEGSGNKDKISYLPTINSPATELCTVHEILKQAMKIKEKLGLKEIVTVFDQAIYAKVCEVMWSFPLDFKAIIPRMGIFHTICVMLGIIGKRFEDSGFKDLCIESGIVAEGSISKILEGKMYNRAIRTHKLVYEAMMRLAWKSFVPWFDINYSHDNVRLTDTQELIETVLDDTSPECFANLCESESFSFIFQAFNKYLHEDTKGLFAFWVSYLDMVEVLLALLRSTRLGNWPMHLNAIRDMLPWCFAYNRINYSRYLSLYYRDMMHLEEDHPETYTSFMDAGFSVQLSSSNNFSRIPMDQTIEETVNRDTQTAGGTKGFSLKPGAVARYLFNELIIVTDRYNIYTNT